MRMRVRMPAPRTLCRLQVPYVLEVSQIFKHGGEMKDLLQGRNSQENAAWIYMGALQGKSEAALRCMKQRRYREVRRCLEEIEELTRQFDALPMSRITDHKQTGGLPAGDKD